MHKSISLVKMKQQLHVYSYIHFFENKDLHLSTKETRDEFNM